MIWAIRLSCPMSLSGPSGCIVENRMGGRQARLALALLVVERGRAVPRHELAEALWPTGLPASWEPALRGVVSRVRAALAAAGYSSSETLTSASGSYQLRLPPGTTVDIEAASAAAEAAEAAFRQRDWKTACREASACVEIGAKPFLPGEDSPWVRRVQAELRTRLLRALEILSAARVEAAEVVLAVEAAEQAVAIDPLRESAHRCLMAAHAEAGNRGDALRAYERCRRILAEELGVSPSDETAKAYVRLLGSEPAAPEVPPSPVPPVLPFPAVLRLASPFVDRGRELASLRTAWQAALEGRRQVVLIGGEPGMGKTGLVAQFAWEVHAAGATVLYGRCDEHLNTPYEPFGEALGRYLNACSTELLRQRLRGLSPELVRLAPELARRLPELPAVPEVESERDRHRMFAAASALLAAVTATSPLLLAIEDVQWGGSAALLLLRYLTRTLESSPVLLVVTYRANQTEANRETAKTLSGLKREAGVQELVLPGLDARSIEGVIDACSCGPLKAASRELARAIRAETGGNTLFVRELVQHLARLGTPHVDQAHQGEGLVRRLGADIPAGLSEVVRARRSPLGEVANAVLNVAAVIGHEFEVDVVARVVGLHADVVVDALDEVVGAGFAVEAPGAVGVYRFTHGLIQGVVYHSIGTTRRARQHARVAAAMEEVHAADLDSRAVELSHHYWEARRVGGAEKAVDYALRAGEQALDQLAYEKAAWYFQRALNVGLDRPGDEHRRCKALMAVASAQRQAGHIASARDAHLAAADLSRRLGDSEALAAWP